MNITPHRELLKIFTSLRVTLVFETKMASVFKAIAQSFIIMKIKHEIGFWTSDFGCKEHLFSVYITHNDLTEC